MTLLPATQGADLGLSPAKCKKRSDLGHVCPLDLRVRCKAGSFRMERRFTVAKASANKETLERAASELTALVEKHLLGMPAEEREQRIAALEKAVACPRRAARP